MNPALITFDSKESSRTKLYDHIVSRLGLTVEKFKTGGYMVYLLVNPNSESGNGII